MNTVAPTIRCARPEEADLLTALALRSKAHWGYDATFMLAAVPELTITRSLLERAEAYVAENDGGILGFYILDVEEGVPMLRDLWIEPRVIKSGVGSLLWRHMLAAARALGVIVLRIESEPFAEGFYLKMGARRIGEVHSKIIEGRMLPLLEFSL